MASSGYVSITRIWQSGDTVTLSLPKSLHLEPTADNPQVSAIMWGPLALAGEVGPRIGRTPENAQTTPRTEVPMLVTTSRQPSEFVTPLALAGDFRVTTVARRAGDGSSAGDVSLTPFYRTHRRRYSLYFDLLTPTEFEARVATLASLRAAAARLLASTIGLVQVGDTESERDRNYQSEPKDRVVGRAERRTNRAGTGWFSYDLPANATSPMALVVTHFVEPGLPAPLGNFDVMVDGTPIAHYAPNNSASGFTTRCTTCRSHSRRGKHGSRCDCSPRTADASCRCTRFEPLSGSAE